MSINEMEKKIATLKEWEDLLEEAKAQVEALKDEIKAEMLSRNTEELTAGRYICRWASVLSNRFDTTTFKKKKLLQQPTKATQEPTATHIGADKYIIAFLLRKCKKNVNKEL